MTLLLLIRHAVTGETGKRLSGQAGGIHLSEAGDEQAAALALRLEPVPVAAVYSSPLERCVETARAVARPRGMEVQIEPGIIEVAYGRWTGRPLAQLSRTALWKQLQGAPSTMRFPGGESLAEVQHRAVAALDALAARHPKKIVAAFTHADVIRLAVSHYAGVHLDLFQRFIVGTTSVSAVLLGDRIPRIVRLNDGGSLEDLAPRRPAARARRGSTHGRAAAAPRARAGNPPVPRRVGG
jgi:probable phosphomutase (TIGR03848 family)